MLYQKHDCKSKLNVLLNIEKKHYCCILYQYFDKLAGQQYTAILYTETSKRLFILIFILKLANQHNYLDNALAYIK